jgi:glutamate synthase domain-containing protein 3
LIIVLGIPEDARPLVGKFLGTGMHGGTIYLRGPVPENFLGKEVSEASFNDDDAALIKPYLTEFCQDFGLDFSEITKVPFRKIVSQTSRPYGRLYAY